MLWAVALIISFGSVGGCANVSEGEKWHFHGYIIEEKENQILLVDGVTKTDISRKTVEQLLEKGSTAIWLSTEDIDKTYSIGDKVYVWTTGNIETSDPARGTATKIEIARFFR